MKSHHHTIILSSCGRIIGFMGLVSNLNLNQSRAADGTGGLEWAAALGGRGPEAQGVGPIGRWDGQTFVQIDKRMLVRTFICWDGRKFNRTSSALGRLPKRNRRGRTWPEKVMVTPRAQGRKCLQSPIVRSLSLNGIFSFYPHSSIKHEEKKRKE